MGEVLRKCEICPAFDKAPYLRAAGTSPGLPRNEKFQADLLSAGGAIALCAMDMYSECPPFVRVRPKNPTGVCDAFPGLRIAVFGARGSWNSKKVRYGAYAAPWHRATDSPASRLSAMSDFAWTPC